MSKRSSRRKRKQRQKREQVRLTGPVLAKRGMAAFKQTNYDEAIGDWRKALNKPDVPAGLPAALAEAYFRRAVSRPTPDIADLQRAVKLQPADFRYRYHIGLAHHRAGDLDQAEAIYRQLLDEDPDTKRVAISLAQLLIETKKPLSKDPVWEHLDDEAQRHLFAAEALVRKKADSTLHRLAQEPLDDVWQGLIALATNDQPTAQRHLQAALEQSNDLSALPRGVIRYYLGVLAAEAGQTNQALKHWQAAKAVGLGGRSLKQNLSAVAYQQALNEQQAGRPKQAAELLEAAGDLDVAHKDLMAFRQHITWAIAYAAAQQGDWEQALDYWQDLEDEGNNDRKLLLNLALAYQKMEYYWEAAERWRHLLRRRPRKANHPEALSDEQVARIWQNVAENYSHAGDYDEAVKTYKNAIKWAPDNVDLRLKLVEALQTEGRWQAAENELNRILAKEPDHIQALTLLAESYSNDYFPHQAKKLWLRILELEPQNPVARQQLAHLYERQGLWQLEWGEYEQALEIFQEGLELVPNSQRLLLVTGGVYAHLEEFDQTRDYFARALVINPHDLQTLYTIFVLWADHGFAADMDQTFDQIKAIPGPVPVSFFLDLVDQCLRVEQPERAETILEFVAERYADDDEAQVGLAMQYAELDQKEKAVSILRSLLKKDPKHAEANFHLGTLYYQMGQTRLAKRHWKEAEIQARQTGNHLLLHQLQMTKDNLIHGKAMPKNPLEMIRNMPPEVLEAMLGSAPPEVADLIRNMDPDMLAAMMGMEGPDDFDFGYYDDDDDDDDYYYGPGPRRK